MEPSDDTREERVVKGGIAEWGAGGARGYRGHLNISVEEEREGSSSQ